jgi:hypothetical protein
MIESVAYIKSLIKKYPTPSPPPYNKLLFQATENLFNDD